MTAFEHSAQVNHEFLITSKAIYRGTQKTPYVPEKFTLLGFQRSGNSCESSQYATLIKDKNGTYYGDKKLSIELSPTQFAHLFISNNQQIYALTEGDGLKRLNLTSAKTLVFEGNKTPSLVLGATGYLLDAHAIKSLDAKELGIDMKTFEVYASLDDQIIFRDRKRFYQLGDDFESSSINVPAKLLFISNDEVILQASNRQIYRIDKFGVMEVKSSAPSVYSIDGFAYVAFNPLLSQLMQEKHDPLTPNQGMFMTKNALVYIDGTIAVALSPQQHKDLSPYIVPVSEFEKGRQDQIKKLKENSHF